MIISLPFEVIYILNKLRAAHYDAYIVGGAVRDILGQSLSHLQNPEEELTLAIADFDFTTNATPPEIQKLFAESYYENEFGMVAISHPELLAQIKEEGYQLPNKNLQTKLELKQDKKNRLIDLAEASKIHESLKEDQPRQKKQLKKKNKVHDFEITTYRSEAVYKDFRHPSKISWGKNISQDLTRRDFTINAMALKVNNDFLKQALNNQSEVLESNYLLKANQYQLIDEHQGMKHLSAKLIATVGQANDRFKEDALRMLRAIRFAVQLGFSLEPAVLSAIKQNSHLIKAISWERIRDEFLKMLISPQAKKAILLLDETKLLEYILPELRNAKGTDQAGHHTTDVWQHSLDAVQNCPSDDPIVRLATLLHDIGKPHTQNILKDNITFYNHDIVGSRIASKIGKRLRLSKVEQKRLFVLVRYHMFYYQPHHTDAAIRRFMRKVGLENVDDILDVREGDRLGSGAKKTSWRLEEMKQRMVDQLHQPMDVTDLAINGHDLMEKLNINPGPIIGDILEQLLDLVLEDPQLNTKEKLLAKAAELS